MVGYSFFFVPLRPNTKYMMKSIIITLPVIATALFLVACGGKKKSDDIITQRVVTTVSKTPVRMTENTDEHEVQWIGKNYRISIHRQPTDSLPMVRDDSGQKFVDNVFTLSVSRQDGSIFFSRKFTKSNFIKYVGDDFYRTGILEGFVFDRAEGDWLEFGASVGRPQTDEYIPLVIRLSRMGVVEIKLDDQLDTSPDSQRVPKDGEGDDDGV